VPENFYTARVDHKLSANDGLFGTYLYDDTDFTQPDSFNNVLLKSHTRRQTVVLGESHTFGLALSIQCELVTAAVTHSTSFPLGRSNPAAALTSLGSTTGQAAQS